LIIEKEVLKFNDLVLINGLNIADTQANPIFNVEKYEKVAAPNKRSKETSCVIEHSRICIIRKEINQRTPLNAKEDHPRSEGALKRKAAQ
jgi:hypothetical protein